MQNKSTGLVICLALIALVMTGCGKEQAELVPVTGVVTIKGAPAADILVRFMPDGMEDNAGPSSYGVTNEQGEFSLTCDDGRVGAVPGNHVVTFVDTVEERPAQGEVATKPPRVDSIFTTAAGGKRLKVVAGEKIELALP